MTRTQRTAGSIMGRTLLVLVVLLIGDVFSSIGFGVAAIWTQREPLRGELTDTAALCAGLIALLGIAIVLLAGAIDDKRN